MQQQRPVMSREELENSISLALIKNVPGNRNGPDDTALMKANVALREIMNAIDNYLSSRGK